MKKNRGECIRGKEKSKGKGGRELRNKEIMERGMRTEKENKVKK